jgi:hypothetical protein
MMWSRHMRYKGLKTQKNYFNKQTNLKFIILILESILLGDNIS